MATIETYYLIDFENVHGDGLAGGEKLKKTDHVVIFFTDNARNIDMTDLSKLGEASKDTIKVPDGKQSADMHIGSYLGYLAGKYGNDCKVVIISKDTDYDKVIKFWKDRVKLSVSREQQIGKKEKPEPKTVSTQSASTGKAAAPIDGSKKTELNRDVMQAMSNAGFKAPAVGRVAQIAVRWYGDEDMLSKVLKELEDTYSNHLEVYAAVEPVLKKYAGGTSAEGPSQAKSPEDKTAVNTEVQKILSKAGYPTEVVSFTASTVVKNLGKQGGKQQVYRTLISKYGQLRGLEIYNHIKKLA